MLQFSFIGLSFLINNNKYLVPIHNKIKMLQPQEIIDLTLTKSYKPDGWSYSQLSNNLNNIDSVAIINNQNVAILSDKFSNIDDNLDISNHLHYYKYIPSSIDSLINLFIKKNIDFQVFDVPLSNNIQIPFIFQFIGGYLILSFFLTIISNFFGNNGMNGSNGMNPFNSMNKKANFVEEGSVTTTFQDVAGLDEAKEELEEIVDFLKNPFKYGFAGAKIPKGVLLEGPPGTGKTLLARAVAGEAGVSFISASGSEFIEMFVGVGAQRVRNLFKQAQENKPCVIFIDEIDAVGGRRGYGFNSGGNDEREQTLNQILTNMDGFSKDEGIIVLAATNRADTLDEALKRSGRFDRKININLPDLKARKEISKVHFKNKPNISFNYDNLAALTSGFSGADLANLANEAALLKVRNNSTLIDDSLILKAYEKMTIGLPKKYDNRPNNTLSLVAYHEIGHAMMVKYFSEYFNLQKVTLNSNTAGAGGYTLFTPNEMYMEYPTKGFFLAQMIVALGGRAAEIVLYKNSNNTLPILEDYNKLNTSIKITAGASNDLLQANRIARQYIKLFEIYLNDENRNILSDSTKSFIDDRTQSLIEKSLKKAIYIIENDLYHFHFYTNKLLNKKIINF
jgi:cell division protease FtsH